MGDMHGIGRTIVLLTQTGMRVGGLALQRSDVGRDSMRV
jgi:hypothetical protein